MYLARVIGTVVATQKESELTGLKFLLLEGTSPQGKGGGSFVVAADAVGAGLGDLVMYASGSSARQTSVTKDRLGDRNLPQEEIQVPTITLDELLEENGVSRIDFLSMDIEGSAPAALAGFDVERYRPALVCIEAGREPEYQRGLMEYFASHGYERIDEYLSHDAVNWYFKLAE